jgi:hypothetical protein
MISEYKPGMVSDVSVGQFRVTLEDRRVNAMEALARKVGKRVAQVYRERYGRDVFDTRVASDMAKSYGVHKLFIPYTVECARRALNA